MVAPALAGTFVVPCAFFVRRRASGAWYDYTSVSSTASTAIVLLRADVVARMRQHFGDDGSIAVFDASDGMPPVTVVDARAQMLLVVDRAFAENPAGMDFLERFREANPETEIRCLNEDAGGFSAVLEQPVTHPGHLALRTASQPLRRTPGRRAPRVNMPPDTTAIINGVEVQLVNISPHGAQVLSPQILRPGEHVHARIPDSPRRRATVIWSTIEMMHDTHRPGYRAGLSFA